MFKSKEQKEQEKIKNIEEQQHEISLMRQKAKNRINEIITIRQHQTENGFTPCYCEKEIPRYHQHCYTCTHEKCTARVIIDVWEE